MNRLLLSLFSLFIFSFLLQAQTGSGESNLAYIEANGIVGAPLNEISTETILDSSIWTSTTNAPNNIGRVVAGVIGEYLYVFTGQNTTTQAVAYHIPTKVWINSTPCTGPGYNAAFCVARGELYKLSGTGSTNVFEKFTPDNTGTGTWTVLPAPGSSFLQAQNSIVFDGDNFIYASSADYATPTNSFFARYDIQNSTWTTLVGSPFPKRYAGMAAIGGKIYLIGGLIPAGVDPKVCQVYDPATSAWSTIASALEDLNFTKWSVSTDGTYIWLIGSGGGYSSYPLSNKVYYYDPVANTWHLESQLPADKGLALGLFMTGYQKLFFGGGNVGGVGTAFTNTCWEGTGGIYVPVEFASFNAITDNNTVTLQWTTATEINNKGFEIEKQESKSDKWNSIGFVNGRGTTTEVNSYTFTENDIASGKYIYRLKQIDYDGSFTYSKEIEVDVNGLPVEFGLYQNFPNPFNPSTVISFSIPQDEHVTLKVYDILGNEITTLLNEPKQAGVHQIEFSGKGLASGAYFYKLNSGEFTQVKKFILSR